MRAKRVVIDGKQECIGCNQWLDLELFGLYSNSSTGRNWRCKECLKKTLIGGLTPSQRSRKWALENPERARENNRLSQGRVIHNESRLKRRREYNYKFWHKNKEACQKSHKNWMKNHPWAHIADKARSLIRATLNGYLDGGPKFQSTVGCTGTQLRKHLEKQFKSGMSWDNYGRYGWTLGHIKPCCHWNELLLTEQGLKECFHFSNLQPEWAHENSCKFTKQVLTKAQHSLIKIPT